MSLPRFSPSASRLPSKLPVSAVAECQNGQLRQAMLVPGFAALGIARLHLVTWRGALGIQAAGHGLPYFALQGHTAWCRLIGAAQTGMPGAGLLQRGIGQAKADSLGPVEGNTKTGATGAAIQTRIESDSGRSVHH